MPKAREGRRQVALYINDDGLIARLLADYQHEHGITSINRAMTTLLIEGLLDYMQWREGDDPALYDMLRNEWLGTLNADAEVTEDDFVDWLVSREMPRHGGSRAGSGRKSS